MEVEKIRNTTDTELQHQQRELADQLFRLRFQLKMGQTESLKKLRGLRKDIARIQTVIRERQLGIAPTTATKAASESAAAEKTAATPEARAKRSSRKAAKPAGPSAHKKGKK